MNEVAESPINNKKRPPVALGVRCRSCLFFKSRSHHAYKKPCAELGVKQYSRPCKYYFANPFIFLKNDPEYKLVKKLLVQYAKLLPDLVGWLNQETATKRTGFSFGQTVYVRMIGDDYLLNYAEATVISANREYIYIQTKNFTGTFLHASVYTEEQWKRKKKNLIKNKKIRDPKEKEYYKVKKLPKPIDYDVPTIDKFEKTLAKARVNEMKGTSKKVHRVNKD